MSSEMTTTGTSPEAPSDPRRAWAIEQLGVRPEPTLREQLLRDLAKHEFVPPPEVPILYQTLSAGDEASMTDHEALITGWRDELRSRVEALALAFFDIPVEERTRQWKELRTLCKDHPPLVARLESLGPGVGLDITSVATAPADVCELAQDIVVGFVMRPAEQARQRRSIIDRAAGEQEASFAVAAMRLRSEYGDVANLDCELVDSLADSAVRRSELARLAQRRRRKVTVFKALEWLGGHPFAIAVPLAAVMLVTLFILDRGSKNRRVDPSVVITPSPSRIGNSSGQIEAIRKAIEYTQRIPEPHRQRIQQEYNEYFQKAKALGMLFISDQDVEDIFLKYQQISTEKPQSQQALPSLGNSKDPEAQIRELLKPGKDGKKPYVGSAMRKLLGMPPETPEEKAERLGTRAPAPSAIPPPTNVEGQQP